MSSVIVVTPLIIASWPVITAAVSAAIYSLGYTSVQGQVGVRALTDGKTRAEIEVEESEVLAGSVGSGEQIVVERNGVRATFSRDARGALKVCMEGEGVSKAELKQFGEELVGRVTQMYVYNKLVTEMNERNMAIVEEEVAEDRTIRIRVRNH